MTTGEVETSSDHQLTLQQLRANAAHCRALAQTATDPEVELALMQLAKDIDTAISVIEQNWHQIDAGA